VNETYRSCQESRYLTQELFLCPNDERKNWDMIASPLVYEDKIIKVPNYFGRQPYNP
jgi:hypothetical protein